MPENFVGGKKDSLHFGHLGAILFCAVLLIGVGLFKGGFKVFQTKHSGGADSAPLTYEQARLQAEKNLAALGLDPSLSEEFYRELALVDPNFGQGSVLGLSTNTLESLGFPTAEEILNPEYVNLMPIQSSGEDTLESMENYKLDIDSPAISDKAAELLESLSQDNSPKIETQRDDLLRLLVEVKVPKPVEEYHRLTMLNFFYLVEVYKESLKPEAEQQNSGSEALLVAVSDRLSKIKNEIKTKFEIEL